MVQRRPCSHRHRRIAKGPGKRDMESGGFGRFRWLGSNPSARTSKPLKSFIAVRGIRTRADWRARQRWASQTVVLFCSTRSIGSLPSVCNPSLQPTTAFSRLTSVHRADLEGQLRVEGEPSLSIQRSSQKGGPLPFPGDAGGQVSLPKPAVHAVSRFRADHAGHRPESL